MTDEARAREWWDEWHNAAYVMILVACRALGWLKEG